jgi:uncharacterized protein
VKEKIRDDMKQAMRAKDSQRLGTIRLMMAAIQQREVDERIQLDDTQVFAVLDKMIKQRRDSVMHYTAAARSDLVDQENYEISLIQTYLPLALTDAEVDDLIKEAIREVEASTVKDMGKVMAFLKPKIQARADVGAVSDKVRSLLGM